MVNVIFPVCLKINSQPKIICHSKIKIVIMTLTKKSKRKKQLKIKVEC